MMNLKEGLALAAGLALMATAAVAETKSGSPGSFSDLSPGNQNIARALFYAQHPAPNGQQPLNMNQIAELKGHEGWGEVFKQMKAEGLVNDKNLGEVISSYHHLHNTHAASSNGHTIVTTGNGHAFASGSDNGHGQAGKPGDAGSEGAEHGFASADHGHDVTVSTAGGATSSGGGASVASAGGGGSHGVAAGHAH